MMRAMLAMATTALLSACLQYNESYKFNKDGSGSVTVQYALSKGASQKMEEIKGMAGMGLPVPPNFGPPLPFTQEELKPMLLSEDIKISSLKVVPNQMVTFTLEFKKVEDLQQLSFPPFKDSTFSFAEADCDDGKGNEATQFVFTRNLKSTVENTVAGFLSQAKGNPMVGAQLDSELEKFTKKEGKPTFLFSVEMPETIGEANVKEPKKDIKGKKATWKIEKEMTDGEFAQEFEAKTKAKKK